VILDPTPVPRSPRARVEVRSAADRLEQEFDGIHSPEQVLICLERCWERLQAAGRQEDATGQAEVMARAMLNHPSALRRWL
jgi:hypothetical protein